MHDRTVEAVRLDFLTETSRLLFFTQASSRLFNRFSNSSHTNVSGSLAAVWLRTADHYFGVLINLETERVMLLTPAICDSDVVLISGHIVLASADTYLGTVRLDVWTEQSLAKFWCSGPLDLTWCPLPTRHIPTVCSKTIKLPMSVRMSHKAPCIRLSAHRSPLCEGMYRIWMYVFPFHYATACSGPAAVAKFLLSVPPASPSSPANPNSSLHLQVQFLQRVKGYIDSIDYDISYSGHTAVREGVSNHQHRVLALPELGYRRDSSVWDSTQVIHRLDGDFVHVSQYGGALTYMTCDSIVVKYYE
jgi:hypothetical protein